MKKNFALVDVLLKMRMKKLFGAVFAVALINILCAFIFTGEIDKATTLLRVTDTVAVVTFVAAYMVAVYLCLNLNLVKNKKHMTVRRLGISRRSEYIAILITNIVTFTILYLALTLIITASFAIVVKLHFGADKMVQLMVMNNNSFLFGELLPVYQPMIIVRNILFIVFAGQLTAYISGEMMDGQSVKSVFVGIGVIVLGFGTREMFLAKAVDYSIYSYFQIVLLIALIMLVLSTVIGTIKLCKSVDNKKESNI